MGLSANKMSAPPADRPDLPYWLLQTERALGQPSNADTDPD
jgi:hypothetical protein